MADSLDLAGILPIPQSGYRNAQILSGLGYSEEIPQLLHFGSPWRGVPEVLDSTNITWVRYT